MNIWCEPTTAKSHNSQTATDVPKCRECKINYNKAVSLSIQYSLGYSVALSYSRSELSSVN